MPLSSLPAWAEWLGTGAGGAALMKGADLIFGRKDRDTKRLSDQLDRTDARMEKFEKRLDECHENHEACERGRQEDRKKIDELEAEVRRFMAGDVTGDVAPYMVLRRPRVRAKP